MRPPSRAAGADRGGTRHAPAWSLHCRAGPKVPDFLPWLPERLADGSRNAELAAPFSAAISWVPCQRIDQESGDGLPGGEMDRQCADDSVTRQHPLGIEAVDHAIAAPLPQTSIPASIAYCTAQSAVARPEHPVTATSAAGKGHGVQ